MQARIHSDVQAYYGQVLKTKDDLQTTACCTDDAVPGYLKPKLALIADEIHARFYGCGSPIPHALEGLTILDLGCGTGRDAYLCAQLVGPTGRVIGVDMTQNQLDVALAHVDEQMATFGFKEKKVDFRLGYMEALHDAGVADASVDVVISNCVLNLAPDKDAVFREIFRVLKPGGELYFSDVFVDRRLPEEMRTDPVMVGECLGGAMYTEDFRRLMRRMGIRDYRLMSSRIIEPSADSIQQRMGNARFYSMTVRAFNLPALEDRCEDYGQVAWYLGSIEASPHRFVLDDHHTFIAGKPMPVCANTASMLQDTRFKAHFRVEGDTSVHFGLFDCDPVQTATDQVEAGACC
ncbi:MAG: methyltransferase domain-containing protein [Myxococcota bacterium]|nr:methyltransferase domain-containing protein [Myxococcota bacterium]